MWSLEAVCLKIKRDYGSEVIVSVCVCVRWNSELCTAKGIYSISYLKVNWISAAGVGDATEPDLQNKKVVWSHSGMNLFALLQYKGREVSGQSCTAHCKQPKFFEPSCQPF